MWLYVYISHIPCPVGYEYVYTQGFPDGSVVKNLPANSGDSGSTWVGKIPWRRNWQPTPVFLPGKSHGQRSRVGYSPWVCKRPTQLSNWITPLHTHIHLSEVSINSYFLEVFFYLFCFLNYNAFEYFQRSFQYLWKCDTFLHSCITIADCINGFTNIKPDDMLRKCPI